MIPIGESVTKMGEKIRYSVVLRTDHDETQVFDSSFSEFRLLEDVVRETGIDFPAIIRAAMLDYLVRMLY